jgi:hypothetical protein
MRLIPLHRFPRVTAFSVALFMTAPSVAVAQQSPMNPAEDPECIPPKVTFDERRFAVHGIVGFGSPVGTLGADFEYNPLSRVALGVGAGTGGDRFEMAVVTRLRPVMFERPKRAQAITLGVAGSWASRMSYPGFSPSLDGSASRVPPIHADIEPAYWIHTDVGYELRVRNGFSMFVSLGLAWLINQGDATCQSGGPGCSNNGTLAAGIVLPPIATLSVGLGFAPR